MRPGRLLLALLLIIIGVVLLAANLGWIDWDFALSLWQLWPLVLVVLGIYFLLGRRQPTVAVVLILLIVAGGAFFVWYDWNQGGSRLGPETTTAITAPANAANVSRGEARIDAGATEITVSGGAGPLLQGSYRSRTRPEINYSRSDGTFVVRVSQKAGSYLRLPFGSRSRELLDLRLGSAMPWDLSLNTGAAKATLDLTDVTLGTLDVNAGASTVDITAGEKVAPGARISLKGGAGTYRLSVPRGLRVNLSVTGGLSSKNIASEFRKEDGDRYVLEGGGGTLDVNIDTGVSSVRVDVR